MIKKNQRPSEDSLEYQFKIAGLPYDYYEDALGHKHLLIYKSSSEAEPIQSWSVKKNQKNQRANTYIKSLHGLEDNTETMSCKIKFIAN